MSVHYKFKSAVEYDTLPVDGLHISLADLKDSIIQQKRLGKGQPYDLQITNAETKEVYTDDKVLIPKNTSLIVARIPIDPSQMKRPWESKDATALILSNPSNLMNTDDAAEAAEIDRKIKEVTDLTRMKGSEQDKINAMVAQSTMDYHPSKYVKLRASKMTGVVPLGYKCYKCNKSGHWVTMCPLNNQDLRKSTGIPSMFLEEANDPNAPGVMITQTGKLVRMRDMGGDSTTANLPPAEKRPPPEELECKLCKEILKDAVLIPCCAEAYCDECIRNHLLDSEDHICPDCGKSGVGPDGLIPNRYLRIKVQEFECGWFLGDKKTDVSSDGGEALSPMPSNISTRVSPTPPCSPARLGASPARIRISSNLIKSPASQAASPIPERSPLRANVVECVSNGDLPPSTENPVPAMEEKGNAGVEIRDASGDFDTLEEQMANDEMLPDEKENMVLKDCDTSVDEKPKKIKRKKGKRKNSRHESEEEKDKRKKKERSHKSQDKKSLEKKSKRHSSEQLKDVDDLPDDRSELWDDTNVESKVSHDSEEEGDRSRRSHAKEPLSERLKDDGPPGEEWSEKRKDSIRERSSRSRSRSRSNSEDEKPSDKLSNIDIVPFNPHVPPPNFVKSPPQGYQYSVTSTYVPQVPRPVPVTSDTTYPHYQPGLIADPLTEFERHMREKDERDRKWRYSRSRSPSRSPRYRRARSRSRQRSWSHSRSRSTSRTRLGPSVRSPRSQSRRWWSRSPPPRGHTYRSRSPSYTRERSVSNRSLSLSRSPSPGRRVGSSPLRVLPHVHPDPHALARPPMNYNMQGDINRYQVPTVPHDQYQYQQPPHQTSIPPVTGPWEQPPPRYNQGRPETMRPFRGRRGRGGFRGQNFDHRGGHDYRYQDFRGQRMMDDRRVMQGSGGWDRDGRQNFNTELPRVDRNGRPYDSDRRRYGDVSDYDDGRNRRYDGPNSYSDEEWRYSDDGRKRDEEFENRRYEGRRGRDDRKEDPDFRKGSDEDDYDYKRSRRDGDRGRSYDRSYKDMDDGRSNRHDREGKNRDLSSRRDSPRDDELHYHSKSYDSPGKSHKKTPPKDRRDKDIDRRERDSDRRERDYDKREIDGDKRDRDSDGRRDRDPDSRRDRDSDRRERDSDKKERSKSYRRDRDDRRERDFGRQESDRKEKGSDRKDSYKRDKDQDRKLHDDDRKDKEGDRRERDSTKHERESTNRDKSDRNGEEERRERTYISRWDHSDTKMKPEKGIEKDGKSHEGEPIHSQEEREHKRKSRRKEDKDESHHGKDKGESTQEGESSLKAEKKKHDKKKKKKEKRRASQASTEASQGEMSGDEGEDKKKKKKREKKRKSKGTSAEGVEDPGEKVASENTAETDPKDSDNKEMPGSYVEHGSEMAVHESTPEAKPSAESSMAQLPMPPLSKWERDEDITLTPKGLSENKTPEEENKDKVTVDILKRAENTIFSGRGLVTRKVFLDPQKQKEGEEKERSPTPEWERLELREAKRRGPSIQITISSKTESQIGRPRGGGRYQPSSPEHGEDKRYSLRSRRGSETDKSEKHLRNQKRSQSPSEAQGISKTRRKIEKEQVKEEKDNDASKDQNNSSSDFTSTAEDKVKESTDDKLLLDKDLEKQADSDSFQDSTQKLEMDETKFKQTDSLLDSKPDSIVDETKDAELSPHRGVKRPSSSADELEIKKVKVDDDDPSASGLGGISDMGKTVSPSEKDNLHVQEHDDKSMYHDSGKEVKVHKPVMQNFSSNLVTIPLLPGEPEELEEGEIASDFDDNAALVNEVIVGRPKEINNMEPNEPLEEMPAKTRYSPIRVPSPIHHEQHDEPKELMKVKEKSKKRKKRKKSSSSSSSDSSSSSSSDSSSDEEEISKKKKKKKKKKKAAVLSESSDGESQRKHKKKKKEKKKKKKKSKKKSDK